MAKNTMSVDKRAPEYKDADRKATHEPTIPAARARQGVTRHNIRYVLGFSIAGSLSRS